MKRTFEVLSLLALFLSFIAIFSKEIDWATYFSLQSFILRDLSK